MSDRIAIVTQGVDGFRISIDRGPVEAFPNAVNLAESHAVLMIHRDDLLARLKAVEECCAAYQPTGNNVNYEANFNGLRKDVLEAIQPEIVF